jgi:hypothetical protein
LEAAMKRVALIMSVCAVAWFAGCFRQPTKSEFLKIEADCFRCYCFSNAPVAEAALLECERYARQCQENSVNDILYDEVLFRTYGRLYLVSRHLGKRQAAEEYLQKAAECQRRFSGNPARTNRPTMVMRGLIEQDVDHGLTVVWKSH